MAKTDFFKLKQPCKDCPFRRDSPKGWLGGERARQIADSLHEENGMGGGSVFPCHKTVDYSDEDHEAGRTNRLQESNAYCAGAISVVEKECQQGGPLPLPLQIAERMGLYDPTSMKIDDTTFDSFDEFVDHHDSLA